MRFNKKLVGAALVVATIAFSGAASTASNTVSPDVGQLGYSNVTVTGGTINEIDYIISTDNPPEIDSIELTITDTAAVPEIQIRLNTASTTWDSCALDTDSGATSTWDCTLTGDNADVTATALVNLYIVIQ